MSKRTLYKVGAAIGILVFHTFISSPELTPPLIAINTSATALRPLWLLVWSPQGDKLAVTTTNEVSIWAIPANEEQFQRLNVLTTPNEAFPFPLAWSPNGEMLAIGYPDEVTQIWDTTAADSVISLGPRLSGAQTINWSPDSKKLAVSTLRETIIWDITSNSIAVTLLNAGPLIWTANNEHFIGNGQSFATRVWDADTNEMVVEIDARQVRLSPDGTRLAGVETTNITTWDIATGSLIARSTEGHNAGVIALSWSPDGTKLASGGGTLGEDFTVRVWDAFTGQQILVLDGHRDDVFGLSWQEDGRHLVSASYDGTLRIWSMPEGDIVRILNLPRNGNALTINPDGTMAAQIVDDNTVQFWSLIDGTWG